MPRRSPVDARRYGSIKTYEDMVRSRETGEGKMTTMRKDGLTHTDRERLTERERVNTCTWYNTRNTRLFLGASFISIRGSSCSQRREMQFVAECGNPLEQNTRPNLVVLSNQKSLSSCAKCSCLHHCLYQCSMSLSLPLSS